MPAERPSNKYYRSRHGAILPLALRQSTPEYRRRTAGVEFKQGKADVRLFPLVRKYLTKVIDDYEERFGNDDALVEAWHQIRVKILDNFGNQGYIETARNLTAKFERDYFTDPETDTYSDEKYQRVKPVITEITNLVARRR